jgi:hypothetical protein
MLFTFQSPIQLIDEPEAFLHPPQAQLLGNMLANHKPTERQLIVATHSGDFVRGVLSSKAEKISVVRITRDGGKNTAVKLNLDQIRLLWSDPILRFSNVLDGLFHESVVLCESDGDCRFFAALLESVESANELHTDALFTTTSGKHRMPIVASALVGLGVKTRVITDFDILRDITPLRDVYEALGGRWTDIEKLWRSVKSSIEQRLSPVTRDQVRERICEVLDSSEDSSISTAEIEKIRGAIRTTSVWDFAKQAGTGIVPSGQSSQNLLALLAHLNSAGLHVVPCGELERFAPTVPNHGPRWVAEVLKRDLTRDPELESARQFIAQVVELNTLERNTDKSPEATNPAAPSDSNKTLMNRLRCRFLN